MLQACGCVVLRVRSVFFQRYHNKTCWAIYLISDKFMANALTKSLAFSPLLQQFPGHVSSELELILERLSLESALSALPEVLKVKVTELCPTLCDPMDYRVHGILQARILEIPPPGDCPNPGIEPRSPTLQADSLPAEPPGKPIALNLC